MSGPPKQPDLSKSNPIKKPEPRTAGAPNIKEDVFKLPEYPDDNESTVQDEPGEEKIPWTDALKLKGNEWKRKSVDFLTFAGNKKDGDKKDEPKDDSSTPKTA